MNDWQLIDQALADYGYRVAARYAALGDCPDDVAHAVGIAAEARHTGTDDDSRQAVDLAVLAGRVCAMLDGLDPPPARLPIRVAAFSPSITVYEWSG